MIPDQGLAASLGVRNGPAKASITYRVPHWSGGSRDGDLSGTEPTRAELGAHQRLVLTQPGILDVRGQLGRLP